MDYFQLWAIFIVVGMGIAGSYHDPSSKSGALLMGALFFAGVAVISAIFQKVPMIDFLVFREETSSSAPMFLMLGYAAILAALLNWIRR